MPQVLHPEGGSLDPEQRGRGAAAAHPAADRLQRPAARVGSAEKCEWDTVSMAKGHFPTGPVLNSFSDSDTGPEAN